MPMIPLRYDLNMPLVLCFLTIVIANIHCTCIYLVCFASCCLTLIAAGGLKMLFKRS